GPSASADPTDTFVAPDATSLRYDTPVFTRDTTLAGNAIAQLSVDFDHPDGTLSANLVDVAPDGSVKQIADAQIRARDRAVNPAMSFSARGHLLDAYHPLTVAARQEVTGVASYSMTFNPLAYVVPRGHKVQLRVAFTDPKYVLPAPLLASMAGETMRVVHGGRDASRLTLSVITGRTSAPGESYDR
ncbi:MAG: hydrolase, partial [Frankiales bacterium]|nr:hydrolase [Frankiales bacterium]